MKKITVFLSSVGFILLGLFLLPSNAHADVPILVLDDPGLNFNLYFPEFIPAGIIVGLVSLTSFLVIRELRKKVR